MTDRIVRGLAYREDGAFIDPPYKVECFLAEEDRAKEVKELLDKHGKVLKREPGLMIRRAKLDGGDLYEITFWDQFKTYATVSKADLSRLVDELSSLTVIESAGLAKMLQDKWRISSPLTERS